MKQGKLIPAFMVACISACGDAYVGGFFTIGSRDKIAFSISLAQLNSNLFLSLFRISLILLTPFDDF